MWFRYKEHSSINCEGEGSGWCPSYAQPRMYIFRKVGEIMMKSVLSTIYSNEFGAEEIVVPFSILYCRGILSPCHSIKNSRLCMPTECVQKFRFFGFNPFTGGLNSKFLQFRKPNKIYTYQQSFLMIIWQNLEGLKTCWSCSNVNTSNILFMENLIAFYTRWAVIH